MLVNTYIVVDSMYSGPKRLQHVEIYVETDASTGEPFYKIQGTYIEQRYAVLITSEREKAEKCFYEILENLINEQLKEAEERQKNSA